MKNSRRNRANDVAKAEKRAGGKPPRSKYEKKFAPPETALGAALKGAGVVKEKADD